MPTGFNRTSNERHGLTKHPLYYIWCNMHGRCGTTTHKFYADYGGRGISVCEAWFSFPKFIEDMGERPDGCWIERIDNDGPYAPDNCKWATQLEQAANKRNNKHITFDGETLHQAEWARRVGLPITTLHNRLLLGWSVERALTTPRRVSH